MKYAYVPERDDPTLTFMVKVLKWPDQMCADEMGFDRDTVRRRRGHLGLEINRIPKPPQLPTERPGYTPPEKENPILAALRVLSSRVQERTGKGYFLDGRPVSTWDMVREANRSRKQVGMKQIGPEHLWVT